jgi:hypothetical protein
MFITKVEQMMLFRRVIVFYCKNDMKQVISLGGAQILFSVKVPT